MAQRTSTATMPTTSTRTKDAEESATLALMTLASAATHAQQCKLHEVQVLLAAQRQPLPNVMVRATSRVTAHGLFR